MVSVSLIEAKLESNQRGLDDLEEKFGLVRRDLDSFYRSLLAAGDRLERMEASLVQLRDLWGVVEGLRSEIDILTVKVNSLNGEVKDLNRRFA